MPSRYRGFLTRRQTPSKLSLTPPHPDRTVACMRIVVLSGHPDDMLAEEISKRQHRVTEQEAFLKAAVRGRDEARAQGRWLTWLRRMFRVRQEKRELARRKVFSRFSTHKEDAIRAGGDAERRVAAELEQALGQDWVLFRGYRNRRGEIDGLLLGPRGLLACEVKYHNATVYISGDDWQSEKYDRYGNLVEPRAPMRDRGGRSPSQQLREPATALKEWLSKRGHRVIITPVVLLAHDRARIAAIQNPTVQVVTSTADLLRLARASAASLDPGQRAAIEKIIRDDHRHHEQRTRRA